MTLLLIAKHCPGCNKEVASTSCSETWHEDCYQAHRAERKTCIKHALCRTN